MSEPLLDKLKAVNLTMIKPVYLKPHVVFSETIESPSSNTQDYLIAHRMTLTLGAEVMYSRNTYNARRHSRDTMRKLLARELYGDIETELLNLSMALHEEDLPKCFDILDRTFKLME